MPVSLTRRRALATIATSLTLIAFPGVPAPAHAQEYGVITGRTSGMDGRPEAHVAVRIDALAVGAVTGDDGHYRLIIPASRIRAGQEVTLTASRVGLTDATRFINLEPGAQLTEDFVLEPDNVLEDLWMAR